MIVQLGAHIPWVQATHYLEQVLELGLAPEFAIKGPEFDSIETQQIRAVSQLLSSADIRPTVHAPFFDLNPGALDPLIREVTCTRLKQALDLASQLGAHLMVLHPGIDKWRYPNLEQVWRTNAEQFFPVLIDQAASSGCRLAIENIYEESPDNLVRLVNALNSEWFGHCFDVGHWHLFGRRPMAEWLDSVGSKLFHLHLHDNHGRADEHLPVGAGTINFAPLQAYLSAATHPISATLEAHSLVHLKQSHSHVISLLS